MLDEPSRTPAEWLCATDQRLAGSGQMALFAIFLLGIVNFAMHQAVLRSRHPLVYAIPRGELLGRISLSVEFVALLGAMLLAGNGYPGWAWIYGGYTVLNSLFAWLFLSRRI